MLQLITILNRCHRFPGFVYEQAHFSSDHKSIEIAVRPRKGAKAVCSRCHQPAPGYDQLPERSFKFIPFWGFLVFLLYSMRRVDCRRCNAVVVEEVPWADGKRTLTRAYMLFLARWARKLSWKETAESFRTSWEKVFDAVEHVVTFGLEHRVLGQIDAIGVDEIQYAKGHKYLTLVYQIDLDVTRLLWVGKERTIESFQGFFTVIGDEIASKIAFVCSDMWEPYLKVIREKCSEALHILDRFHIVAKMNKALDEVRAGESRRMAREGFVPVLKKSRWLLLKREENLKTQQRFRLRDLLRYNLKTVRAYLLKEAFQQLWDYNSATWAGKFLDEWCRQAMRSRIEPMKKIARSLRDHRELILNYFRAQKLLSSGVVEGLNNKAKVTMRKSYGFRTFRCLELALYHSLGKLPEPKSTHEFF
jgi:transposase